MDLIKFNLDGKTALVTGGAGLLGKQHSLGLARAGARVVVADLNKNGAEEACSLLSERLGKDLFIPKPLDVSNEEQITELLNELESSGQKIDVLVNNAAIDPKVSKDNTAPLDSSRLEFFPLEQWNLQINVGLTGAFLCSKHFGSKMADRGHGTILNISSDLSVIAPDQRLYRQPGLPEEKQPVKPVTYSVIKTGLVGLTRYLASYWADKGVRVNSLSPGGVFNNQPEEFVKKLEALIPMGRMAEVEEYQETIIYLCSDASKYMTGQNIVLDGGRSII